MNGTASIIMVDDVENLSTINVENWPGTPRLADDVENLSTINVENLFVPDSLYER